MPVPPFPFSKLTGYDLNQLALRGILSITGTRSGDLAIPGIQIADVAEGSLMAMAALLAAVIQRKNTGYGQFVDVSIFDETLLQTTIIATALEAGLEEEGLGTIRAGKGKKGRMPEVSVESPRFRKVENNSGDSS